MTPQHPAAPGAEGMACTCGAWDDPEMAHAPDCSALGSAAPETETDANGLTNLALSVWSNTCNAFCPEEDRAHAPECLLAAGLHRDLTAARDCVRVVEGERDAEVAEVEREHEKTLAIMEAACDRADLAAARAESAESAHEAEKAALIALADTWERDNEDHLNRFGQHLMGGAVLSCAEHLRSLLGGGEAR